jgi:hypothetical protein
MRYPILLIMFTLLALIAMPLKERDRDKRAAVVTYLLSKPQQEASLRWVDGRVEALRAMPPLQQVLAMTTATILIVCVAVVVSYLINSIAMILGLGVALLAVVPLALLALLGFKRARAALTQHLKNHPEFGPLHSRLSTRLWQKRFNRAAREHGFAREF